MSTSLRFSNVSSGSSSSKQPRPFRKQRPSPRFKLLPETTGHPIWAPRLDTSKTWMWTPLSFALYPSWKDAELLYEDFRAALDKEETLASKENLLLYRATHDLPVNLLRRTERVRPGANMRGMMDFIQEHENTSIDVFPSDIVYNQDVAIMKIRIDPSLDAKHRLFGRLFHFFPESTSPKNRRRNIPLHVLLATNGNICKQTSSAAVLNLLRDPCRKIFDLGKVCGRNMDCPLPMTLKKTTRCDYIFGVE